MAEVLADKLAGLDELTDGDGFTYSWFDMERADLARELSAALTAAGFGPVAEAKAHALEEAADGFGLNSTDLSGSGIRNWLRYRAAAVRGEG